MGSLLRVCHLTDQKLCTAISITFQRLPGNYNSNSKSSAWLSVVFNQSQLHQFPKNLMVPLAAVADILCDASKLQLGLSPQHQNHVPKAGFGSYLFMPSLRKFHSSTCQQKNDMKGQQSKIQEMKCIDSSDMQPVSAGEIKQFLTSSNISFTEGFTCYITTCPRYSRKRLKLNELDKLLINTTTGYFVCHSCKKSGSWSVYKNNICDLLQLIAHKKRLPAECMEGEENINVVSAEEQKELEDTYNNAISLESVAPERRIQLFNNLEITGIKATILEAFKVKVTSDGNGLVLPLFDLDGQTIIGVKIMSNQTFIVGNAERTRTFMRTIPRLHYVGLFGWNLVKPSHTEMILTASEFDAMAVFQETGLCVLSLPLADSVLPQKFIVDVRPDDLHPSPLIALQKDLSLATILKDATSIQHKSIVTFRDLRQDVYSQLADIDQFTGVKWTRYPYMNNLLKGHRRGELTVFTGPTGAGKTTFISDYSLDLCMQGVNTLWGSFEINNARLIKTMLTQFAQMNLVKNLDKFDEIANQFELLPMYFMTFHGQENIRRVIETMSHAVYVHDIAHVVVDNLQFMLGLEEGGGPNKAVDRFYRQDQVVSAFRKFATHANCHVTLVIHPRKERDTEDLTVSSIFGSAKVSQEADNVMILQDKRITTLRGRKYVQVAKNRFDGELGIMLLKFNKDTLSFAASTASNKHSVRDKQKNEPDSDDSIMDDNS